ncbi:AAA family ATPase [Dactylosporangium sp. CS-047395]|uniref:AAA family ATPase n=1 Tax=Dactylosporangium sp. CS-047395 TaxID=3239936 RepID=UPI003D9214E2
MTFPLVPDPHPAAPWRPGAEDDIAARAQRLVAGPARASFDRLVLRPDVREQLLFSIDAVRGDAGLYQEWGLADIEPTRRVALNLFGQPGTGKTMAAHAIAAYLDRPILEAGYADVESRFHGDGPRNVKALFHAAARDGAVLFVDEADALLSRRITAASHGAEQATNATRNQLLLSLNEFSGVAVFATNMVGRYDPAFAGRMLSVHFPMPDAATRAAIFDRLRPRRLPVAGGVTSPAAAALLDGMSGRDIKNVILTAAHRAARLGAPAVTMAHLRWAVHLVRTSNTAVTDPPTISAANPHE